MKKIYSSPSYSFHGFSTTDFIVSSPEGFNKNLGTTGVDGSDALVKGEQNASRNIWDDDLSK